MHHFDHHTSLKQVESRYETAIRAIEALKKILQEQPKYLKKFDLDLIELAALHSELHEIYFTRLFARFESTLRGYWRTKRKKTRPMTKVLLNSIGNQRGVEADTLEIVQEIRVYRNSLIHEENKASRQFKLHEASRHLHKYLSRLPRKW